MSDHRVIWLQPRCYEEAGEDRHWCQDDQGPCEDCGMPSVKYILASQHEAEIAKLREQLGKAKSALFRIMDLAEAPASEGLLDEIQRITEVALSDEKKT